MANYITRLTVDLLVKNIESRDDMMLTVRYVHDFEMALFNIPKQSYYDSLFGGKLSSIKTIDRIWRKAQMDNPSLRGAEWLQRQIQSGQCSSEFINANPLGLNL